MGPPRPQTPRQGTEYPGPVPAMFGTQKSNLLPRVWFRSPGELPGKRKQTGPTAKTNELVFGRPCCFPCALCAQAARFHRAARERRVASTFLAAIAAFSGEKIPPSLVLSSASKRERPGPFLPVRFSYLSSLKYAIPREEGGWFSRLLRMLEMTSTTMVTT